MKVKTVPVMTASLMAGLLLLGCSLPGAIYPGEVELAVATPELPEGWRPAQQLIHYELWWTGPDGEPRRTRALPGEQVAVALPRLANSAVTVTPVLATARGPRRLLPGGALYPADLRGGEVLAASWWRGFEAKLFLELAGRGFAYFQVNQPRLAEELRRRCGDDPWRAEYELVLRRLLEGRFRGSYLSSRDTVATMRELPPGVYLSENLLLPPVETREIGERRFLVLEKLYPGNHSYFHAAGAAELLISSDGEHEPEWVNFGIWR